MILPNLTICYVTGRVEPRFEWFADSLHRETEGDYEGIDLVIVDYWTDENGGSEGPDPKVRRDYFANRARTDHVLVPPKPTVWQGRHRLTRTNYFAAANARNTGICHADDGWIAYADDLAALAPGWLAEVRRAQREGYVALGAYRKVVGVDVRGGLLVHPRDPQRPETPQGVDSRWTLAGPDLEPVPVSGAVMYGCSVAMPVEALLACNGWDERADARGLGSEDYLTGMLLERCGYEFRYCRRMLTIEEDHATATPFVREIAALPGRPDASHVILGLVRDSDVREAPNYFPEGGIREVRRRVLAGEDFPNAAIPEHDWYSGTPLREL